MMTKRVLSTGLRTVLGATLIGGVMLAVSPVQAGQCANRDARRALEVRVLQSELMVAALTCGQRQSYNAFVTSFKPFLKKQGANMRTFFVEQYGPSAGPGLLNRMVTRLANAASQRSLGQPNEQFCAQTAARFQSVLTADSQRLIQLARTSPTATDHGFKTCVEVAGAEPR